MYFFVNDTLHRSKTLGSLVREFVSANPLDFEAHEKFVDDIRVMKLHVDANYTEVLESIISSCDEKALEIFKEECEEAGVAFYNLISKTYYYYHHETKLKVTIDLDGEVYQIFMQKKNSLEWKALRADHAKAKTMLNNYDKLVHGENFGHYIRVSE